MTVALAAALLLVRPAWSAEGPRWWQDVVAARQAAEESGRPILVEFHSVGCGPCARMEQETLADPEVAAVIAERFEAVRVNALTEPEVALQYLVSFYPTVKFIDVSGSVIYDTQGFVAPSGFLRIMGRALSAHEALQRARSAVAAAPADVEAALAIARDFQLARRHQQASDWARKAVTLADAESVTAGEAQYVLGAALTDAEEPARAEQPLINALKLADGADWQWDARLKLGYVRLQRGEDDSGIGMLQTVCASDEAPVAVKAEAERLLRWWGVGIE